MVAVVGVDTVDTAPLSVGVASHPALHSALYFWLLGVRSISKEERNDLPIWVGQNLSSSTFLSVSIFLGFDGELDFYLMLFWGKVIILCLGCSSKIVMRVALSQNFFVRFWPLSAGVCRLKAKLLIPMYRILCTPETCPLRARAHKIEFLFSGCLHFFK